MVARFTGQSHKVVQLDTGLVDDDHVGSGGSHWTCDGCRQKSLYLQSINKTTSYGVGIVFDVKKFNMTVTNAEHNSSALADVV